MKLKSRNIYIWLYIVFIAHLFCLNIYSSNAQQKPSRQAAIDAYSKGEYEKAFREFNLLLESYSKDPLYKYYMGVCLVKMDSYPENASAYLRDALNGSLDIKDIPDDAWFYLGRSQQMAGKYPDAIKSYNNYEVKVGKKKARESDISRYIQECNEGRGLIKDPEYREIDFISETKTGTHDAMQKADGAEAAMQSPVKPVPRKEDLPQEYDKVLSQAMDYQVKADSLNALVSEYKEELGRLPPSQQKAARSKISEMESLALEYQKLADEKFGNTASRPAARVDVIVPASVPDPKKSEEVYSLFSVDPNPLLVGDQKISMDPELPSGLIYRIQVGVFSKPLEASFFKGISPVAGFRITGTEATRYFAGMFRRMADASWSLTTVKQLGFRDAFITAVLDGKTVSIDRALLLENDWSQKPLTKIVPIPKTGEAAASTLIFRVEISRSVKPVGYEVEETYRKLAGNRGYDKISTGDGTIVYLIGKFITSESASDYAGLLNRNGYREAKVVAYAGNKEIPVETAKQLFEKQE